ncbi:ABC-F family ATP-binding cassette domain-containing protein [Cryomorphaceae bacterium]|nr:ABC-F family ATP-binding cassette domain-containing protein [Cryomorphaceae bacterium]
MISVTQLRHEFGGDALFKEVSFQVKPADRIGLTGKNGAGKSTLLKLLAGWMSPSAGSISKPREFTIGYLPQDITPEGERTVREEAGLAFAGIKEMNERIEQINQELLERTDYESDSYMELIQELTNTQERFHLIGGDQVEEQLEKVLFGLGFKSNELDRSLSTFSGGWRMRVELAKLLLSKHDLLLLDEPTNHLDIEAILWLEDFLKDHEGAIMMISHDRQFLDAVTKRTIEIINGGIEDYSAHYSKYLVLREERREKLIQAKKNQDKDIERQKQLIEKFRYKDSKAAFAQSLIKKLDKLERIEVDDYHQKSVRFTFPEVPRSGKDVIKLEEVGKNYSDRWVLEHVDFELLRGDRWAFVGQNGQGKTTLAKIIVGALRADAGNRNLGTNVHLAYYAQDQAESLDPNQTVLESVESVAPNDVRPRVRAMLGAFLFSGETVDKKVSVLSGGERARLAMCRLLTKPVNFLVLDEPTNHLDMISKDALKEALLTFEGTLLVVSHDRHFLKGLTDRVLEFSDGSVKPHLGDIEYFLSERKASDMREVEKRSVEEKATVVKEAAKNAGPSYKERKQILRNLSKWEKKVEELSSTVKEMEARMTSDEFGALDFSEQQKHYVQHEESVSALEKAEEEWTIWSIKSEELT